MFDIFGNIKALLKIQTVCIDNNIFRMHYQVTLIFLVLFSIIVNSRQYFGDPIDCTVEQGSPAAPAIDNYCWMHVFLREGDYVKQKIPGVTIYVQEGSRRLHYYQWVGFMLFFQAILFFIPRYLWKYCWEEGKIKALASGMKGPSTDSENEASRKKLILDYLQRNIGNHNFYFIRYILCEILNLVNVIVQMFLMDWFLGYEFTTYGSAVWDQIGTTPEERRDPMEIVFPKVAPCKFTFIGPNGGPQDVQSICVLPVNIFSEKIYVFLWFWFIILTVITCLGLVYRILTFVPTVRAYILHRRTKSIDIWVSKSVTRSISVGDWFLLYQIGKNIDSLLFGELLKDLGDRIGNYTYNELDAEKK